MKKILSTILSTILLCSTLSGCSFLGGGDSSSSSFTPSAPLAEIIPIVYDTDEIVTADKTEARDVDTWQAQVFTSKGGGSCERRPNSVIHSPWHTLKINGEDVPVYSARGPRGTHSWAWVDVASNKNNFSLQVELTMDQAYGTCVVLPLKEGVEVRQKDTLYEAEITEYGSFTFTFAEEKDAEYTDPEIAPLTIMVTEEEEFEIPDGYNVVKIEPGFYEEYDLILSEENTVYEMEAGVYDISEIVLPSNTNLHIKHGAYIKGRGIQHEDGSFNGLSLLGTKDTFNVHVKSRGLFDCGMMYGNPTKHKAAVDFTRTEDSSVDGLTIINSNNWTMNFHSSESMRVERNLLIGYRENSDGIMMSECKNSVGRYNFVRTGDDGIEFKGTGWGGSREGRDCIYEYNAVWTDKCTGYGIVWENACPMKNMIFRHNSVGFALPTWQAGMPAIDIRLGVNGDTRWGDVAFEDIEIYHVVAPNVITVRVNGDGVNTFGAVCENILFKDITVRTVERGVFLFRMEYNGYGSIKNIQLENVNFCGLQISEEHKSNSTIFKNLAGNVFNKELTIK